MAVCEAKRRGEVKRRGKATLDRIDENGKKIYKCFGYIDLMYDEPIDTCRACRDYVYFCEED